MTRLVTRRRIVNVASHAHIWVCLTMFVVPFLALVGYAFSGPGGDVCARELYVSVSSAASGTISSGAW